MELPQRNGAARDGDWRRVAMSAVLLFTAMRQAFLSLGFSLICWRALRQEFGNVA